MLAHPVRIVDEVGVFSQPFGDLWVAVEELVKVVHLAPRDVALFALLFLEALLPVHECCRVFLQLLSRIGMVLQPIPYPGMLAHPVRIVDEVGSFLNASATSGLLS